ncbi:MAG: hypothetical protein POG74_03450 [Acidocella sp.]|nr:hypothetical protein [Acidocella sp.]
MNDFKTRHIERYRHLTGTVMPALAKDTDYNWPVRNDHCFQRIILDTVCDGVWYSYIAPPAHKNLTLEQAVRAVELCGGIIAGRIDLTKLNKQSLIWRSEYRLTKTPKLPTKTRTVLL